MKAKANTKAIEVNFDGLVGPTHHYAGLALGNLASEANALRVSNPKAAALQGLNKMRLLMHLGIPQAVLPPQARPNLAFLRNLGFVGKDGEVLAKAYQTAPDIFRAAYSASSMWVANAATVTPSADAQDGRLHLTPANLVTYLHRALEAEQNYKLLKSIFSNERYFQIHAPLFAHADFADEGAANHNRICGEYGDNGLHVFVYGRSHASEKSGVSYRNPARQTREASRSIARLHQLRTEQVLFLKQNPAVIEQGVFHNDVISVANQNVFVYHELAFEKTEQLVEFLEKRGSKPLYLIPVSVAELSLKDAVKSYLFNSQLVTLPNGNMALIAPIESQENPAAHRVLVRILESENPISALHFVDCRQSMLNGGGPACLRLRVVLTQEELAACQAVFLNEDLYQSLVTWVERHYRDRLAPEDLLDPALLEESRVALEALNRILQNKKNMPY